MQKMGAYNRIVLVHGSRATITKLCCDEIMVSHRNKIEIFLEKNLIIVDVEFLLSKLV
jgi:hypothetical protein